MLNTCLIKNSQFMLENAQKKHNETNDLLAAAHRELKEKCAACEILKKQLESAENSIKNEAQLKLEVNFNTNYFTKSQLPYYLIFLT